MAATSTSARWMLMVGCCVLLLLIGAVSAGSDDYPYTADGMMRRLAGCTTNQWGEYDSLWCMALFS